MYSFSMAFSPYYLAIAGVGSVLGILCSLMPGLSPVMVLALLLGLTYQMGTDVAICFLLAVFIGANFGGAISAVLINIPGTPDSVPTQMAGFPLAKRGQAGLAIGTALTACMVGNWVGILLLVTSVPLVISVALKFSSWEMSLLLLWAVGLSGALTGGEAPIKGWITGWLGLLIAMVGRETIYGYNRLTFDSMELLLGIPLIPVVIGLFGIAEVIDTLSERTPYVVPEKVGRIFPPLGTFFSYWKTIIRSSIVGLILGPLPGAGPTMAAYVSYTLGERYTNKKFSDGDIEGVVCSEVAGDAEIGGAMLPTLVLGIPGSAGTAIFMAALGLHGVIVGPMVERENPGILVFIYGCLILANISRYLIGFLLIKPSVKLFSTPREVLLPVIVLLAVIGSYSANSSMFDVYLTFAFGILGFAMRKTGYPVAPMVLGVVLGDMLDENFRRAMVTFQDETMWQVIIDRPVGTFLILLAVLTFLRSYMKKRKAARKQA